MEKLRVTVVGQDIAREVVSIFDTVGLNMVNQVNTGMLGNLKALTYTFELKEDEVIEKRKQLMEHVSKYGMWLTAMYVHGDWMRVFIFKTTSLRL